MITAEMMFRNKIPETRRPGCLCNEMKAPDHERKLQLDLAKLLSQGTRANFLKRDFDLEQLDQGRLNRPCHPHAQDGIRNSHKCCDSGDALVRVLNENV